MGLPVLSFLALLVVALDHLTKWMAIRHLRGAAPIDILPGLFRLDYATNTGGAFSLLAHRPALLTAIAAASLLVILWFLATTPREDRVGRVGLALLFGGAVGNLIDRLARGYVVDFFDAYWGPYHWPTFNVADTAICVGAALVVLGVAVLAPSGAPGGDAATPQAAAAPSTPSTRDAA